MARVVIIGGSGHVGTFLVPLLVEAGHSVVNVTRGQRAPYQPNAAWAKVETVELDRAASEADGSFGERIAALSGDIVIDMICFTLESARHLVGALHGSVQHFIHCGTVWVYGHNASVPATEDQPHNAFGEYGTQKAEIETFLLGEARNAGFPATVFRPGHIVGPGWMPLNPAGNFNGEVFERIGRGEQLTLPNFGLETFHHVHADDLARLVIAIMTSRETALGQAFNGVSPQAVNLRGYAETMYRWFGHEPRIAYQPFDVWRAGENERDAQATWEHISRSPCHSTDKAGRLLGYKPQFSSLEAVQEAVDWLIANGRLEIGRAA
jgi:nucleoside-diphosphate-sugar epimerase